MVALQQRFGMKGLGLSAPALFLSCLIAVPVYGQAPAAAQSVQPPASSVPVPGPLELSKMIWSTMAAVDHANQAGNYSVLRDLAAPGFQINNDSARLGQIFASLRASGVDLSNTLLLSPTYDGAPTMPQQGIIRVKGFFGLRPTAIGFDLYYQWVQGKWKLFGVSIVPATLTNVQPGPPPGPVPAPAPVKRP